MATVSPTPTKLPGGQTVWTWSSVTESDTFEALQLSNSQTASWIIGGTFGGATVVIQGSADDSTYVAIDDALGTAVSVTSAAAVETNSNLPYFKPVASGGTSQSLTVWVAVQE